MRTVATFVGAATIATAALGPAPVAWADMQAAFTNTIVSRYPNGKWVKHFFEPGGGYRAEFQDGRRMTAHWAVEGDQVCLTNIRPVSILRRYCTPLVEADIGDTWPARDPLGRRVSNTLVAGR
ncbi:MAG: hypothetical protein EON91_10625 [Brevundimonas sp.]|uniref:hypothetical protein n=1 Tax=Brevundimonas sp. TaxID=1871086 RepID=UPI001208AB2B|nr:hypothetical protein [Brevundimonas sp.]RZJ17124.1 MAG: hypothetical protein EON91_10625 [Brevundimonas sp.]